MSVFKKTSQDELKQIKEELVTHSAKAIETKQYYKKEYAKYHKDSYKIDPVLSREMSDHKPTEEEINNKYKDTYKKYRAMIQVIHKFELDHQSSLSESETRRLDQIKTAFYILDRRAQLDRDINLLTNEYGGKMQLTSRNVGAVEEDYIKTYLKEVDKAKKESEKNEQNGLIKPAFNGKEIRQGLVEKTLQDAKDFQNAYYQGHSKSWNSFFERNKYQEGALGPRIKEMDPVFEEKHSDIHDERLKQAKEHAITTALDCIGVHPTFIKEREEKLKAQQEKEQQQQNQTPRRKRPVAEERGM